MQIENFIANYRNHPVLFIGTGISLRYLDSSYTWNGLLQNIAYELKGNSEYYLDLKSKCDFEGKYDFARIAQLLESDFNESLIADRYGRFECINDKFYEQMKNGINVSRLKIYISELLTSPSIKPEKQDEIVEFKKVRKNIGSIITTNYDCFIEKIFEFEPLIGNNILLSNPYGSVYKIHGCVSQPSKIVITKKDYDKFDEKYELIRAQLLSLFIHNPIVFMGYGIGDDNIKKLLRTIFTYMESGSDEAQLIKNNFLLVEYEGDSNSHEVVEHDIDIEGFSTIRINRIRTDDFLEVYKCLSNLTLPISAMDVRKVQSIAREIYAGGDIQVNITEDLDSLNNSDKIIAIGSRKTIHYEFQTKAEMITDYFAIIDESNSQLLELINKYTIQSSQYFPIFGFSSISSQINKGKVEKLKKQQKSKIDSILSVITQPCKTVNESVQAILDDEAVTPSNKVNAIFWSTINGRVPLENVERYLREFEEKTDSQYKKLLCAYDCMRYS